MKVKKDFEAACNEYLRLFCEKHDYDFEEAAASWVGDKVGGIVSLGDEVVGFGDIRTDIDRDAPVKEFGRWYDYCLRLGMISSDIRTPNYESWLSGCPRRSEEQLLKLEARCAQIERKRIEFEAMIKEEGLR